MRKQKHIATKRKGKTENYKSAYYYCSANYTWIVGAHAGAEHRIPMGVVVKMYERNR